MVSSTSQVPHYFETIELDVSKVLKLRQVLNEEAGGKFKLSVNDFVVKACSLALMDVPQVNSSWQQTFVRKYS
jgi:pyruvate dehydrogenase E2 component (dihydrolipoamide acetyltransferase)